MRKIYVGLFVAFLLVATALPFIVGNIIKQPPYTASDLLGYIATILGISISLVALYFSLLQYVPQLRIKREWRIIQGDDNEYEMIRVENVGNVRIVVSGVRLCSYKKGKNAHRLILTQLSKQGQYPKTIESGESSSFLLGTIDEMVAEKSKFAKALKDEGFNNMKIAFCISLANGREIIWKPKADV